ncbi:hypothetical protein BDA99DRAFT_561984 [Phascolomyces articulosus]|uniref:Transmembrane protein n=1 Tax=Phascolomyces articulosus TaxID=60185 RepID=A0AAD5K645_9FUNG|nr:hypothetical protein BDA99DRAFT_561971 [Phascolomyces articulosus]KAI9256543.1 hypothetical protein BDA99DRAFT_561984 [Phascolomyces articulosus]
MFYEIVKLFFLSIFTYIALWALLYAAVLPFALVYYVWLFHPFYFLLSAFLALVAFISLAPCCNLLRTLIVAVWVQWGWYSVSPSPPPPLGSFVTLAVRYSLPSVELTVASSKQPSHSDFVDYFLERMRKGYKHYRVEMSCESKANLVAHSSVDCCVSKVFPGLPGLIPWNAVPANEKSAWVVEGTGDAATMPNALAYTPTVQDSQVDLLCEQFAAMRLIGASAQAPAYVQHQDELLDSLSVVEDNVVPVVMGDSIMTTAEAFTRNDAAVEVSSSVGMAMDVDVLSFGNSPFEVCLIELVQQQQQWQTSIVRQSSLESLPEEEDTPMDQDDEAMEPTLGESSDSNSTSFTMAGDSSTQALVGSSGDSDTTTALALQTAVVCSTSSESLQEVNNTPMDPADEVMEPTLGESTDNNSSSSTMAGDSSASQTAILAQSLQNMEANTLTNGALHDMNSNSSVPVQQVPVVRSSDEEQREVVGDSAAVVNEVDGASLAADVNEAPLFLWPAEEFLAVVDGNAVEDTAAIQSTYLDMMFSNSFLDMLGAGASGDTPPVGDGLGDSTSGDNIYEGDETLGAEFAYLFNHVNTSVTSDSNQVNASATSDEIQVNAPATSGNDATSVHPDNSAAVSFPPLAPPPSTVEDILGEILADVLDDSEYDALFEEFIKVMTHCGVIAFVSFFMPGGHMARCTCWCDAFPGLCMSVVHQCHGYAEFACVHAFDALLVGLGQHGCLWRDGLAVGTSVDGSLWIQRGYIVGTLEDLGFATTGFSV